MRGTFIVRVTAVFVLLFSLAVSAQLFGGLKAKIENELAANPFLKQEGIRLKVVEEQNGYVTLQMVSGNRWLREKINTGSDITEINGGDSDDIKKSISILRKTLDQFQHMEGVKQVLLTAAVNTSGDKGMDALSKKDYSTAFEWLSKAAEEEDADAQCKLGVMYYTGTGIAQDCLKAATLLRKATEQGRADAQWLLAVMYYAGKGVPQDHAKALELYRQAAEQGHAQAEWALALIYCRGDDVPRDYSTALALYRRSAR